MDTWLILVVDLVVIVCCIWLILWAMRDDPHPADCDCQDCHAAFVARLRAVAAKQAAELDRKEARR